MKKNYPKTPSRSETIGKIGVALFLVAVMFTTYNCGEPPPQQEGGSTFGLDCRGPLFQVKE